MKIFILFIILSFSNFSAFPLASEYPSREVKMYPIAFDYTAHENKAVINKNFIDDKYCDTKKGLRNSSYLCCENKKKSNELNTIKQNTRINNKFYKCDREGRKSIYVTLNNSLDGSEIHLTVIKPIGPESLKDSVRSQVFKNDILIEKISCSTGIMRRSYDKKNTLKTFETPGRFNCERYEKKLCELVIKVSNLDDGSFEKLKQYMENSTYTHANRKSYKNLFPDIFITRNDSIIKTEFLKFHSLEELFDKRYSSIQDNFNTKLISSETTAINHGYFKDGILRQCKRFLQENTSTEDTSSVNNKEVNRS